MSATESGWAVTNLGNASVLIQVDDALVLTDPFFGRSRGISDIAALSPDDVPALTAIIGSHWAQDHWEIDLLADYPHRDTTAVYVADESMAQSARAAGFRHVETLAWGQRRRLTDTVELEVVPEHVAADGMGTNNYAINGSHARVFFGGEVLNVAAVTNYAQTSTPFDCAIGPVNGVLFKGRQLVTTAAEMATVAQALGAARLIPIHDGHMPYEGLVTITSSAADLAALDLGKMEVVTLASGDRFIAG
ncbi:MAG: MBL fold metallo-hydrolase [Actinomycetia bacterium]|nr:MBL fold metallo-hydrolase [Actinomycetes bacterium]